MSNQHPHKPISNTLLQNANAGFSLDSLLNNSLIVPVSNQESNFTETTEIDSFIGQEQFKPAVTVPSNTIVNENVQSSTHKHAPEQSVPLVVPPSSSSSDSTRISNASPSIYGQPSNVRTPFAENATSPSQQPLRFAPVTNSPTVNFFASAATVPLAQSSTSANLGQPVFDPVSNSSRVPAPSFGGVPPPQSNLENRKSASSPPAGASGSNGSSTNYRLGNLKRPAYAPIPGLSCSGNVNQRFAAPFAAANQNQSTVPTVPWTPSPMSDPTVTSSSSISFTNVAPADHTLNMSSSSRPSTSSYLQAEKPSTYRPAYHHWFYRQDTEKNSFLNATKEPDIKSVWKPFSMADSLALENAFSSPDLTEETIVATDGGRYDVYVMRREKVAVYWEERRSTVRRCSWFSKSPTDSYFVPYEEELAAKLEEEFKVGMETAEWNRKIDVGNEEIVMHNSSLITHQIKCSNVTLDMSITDSTIASPLKPKIVKRGGFDDFDIDDGEPEKVDHLMFLVHGIGQFCDLKFRTIVEVVDEFRSISLQLAQSHFQEACELGQVNRIEILPVSWHKALHGDHTGVDKRVKNITLPSIPRMRDFANDTILDILFYTSPVFCQVIINAVASEMNRLYSLFRQRNPEFNGRVSVGGHSLGSLILFDLLSNQASFPTPSESEEDTIEDLAQEYDSKLKTLTRRVSVVTVGKAGTGQPLVKYPRLNFESRFFFAFGSPIACFVATRSNEILGEDFKFPTCKGFFNIFHPYDPIAYRIEPLIIPSLSNVKPVQISHHKGRKRMHLELKDTVSHVGQRLVDTMKNTWNMLYHLTVNKSVDAAESAIQHELNQVLQTGDVLSKRPMNPNLVPTEPTKESTNVKVGCLNEGRRVDYVLQEAPVEYFNEYLFALASHLCYWTSRDSMLLVLKEIYGDMNISSDNQLPQNILPFELNEGQSSSDGSTPNEPTIPLEMPSIYGFGRK